GREKLPPCGPATSTRRAESGPTLRGATRQSTTAGSGGFISALKPKLSSSLGSGPSWGPTCSHPPRRWRNFGPIGGEPVEPECHNDMGAVTESCRHPAAFFQ